MADHFAIQVRDSVIAAVTGLATTGSRVYSAHTRDDALLFTGGLPGILVLTPREDVQKDGDLSTVFYQRTASIDLIAIVEKTAALPDIGDLVFQIAKEIEIALASPLTVAGRQVQFYLSGSIETESSEQGDRLVAMLILPVQALYLTTAGVPDAHA